MSDSGKIKKTGPPKPKDRVALQTTLDNQKKLPTSTQEKWKKGNEKKRKRNERKRKEKKGTEGERKGKEGGKNTGKRSKIFFYLFPLL